MNEKSKETALLSIGALARLSGIPVETLRNWERRYGFPAPARLESGHRRYPLPIVTRLKRIKRALDLGYRPSFALLASENDLAMAISDGGLPDSDHVVLREIDRLGDSAALSEAEGWFDCVTRLDASDLEQRIRAAWARHSAREFVSRLAVPFLTSVGDGWASGALTVAHEHFAAEVLEAFLIGQWRPLAQSASSPQVILANLEGERHTLGLHMAAVFLALGGFRIVFLGMSTPRKDIVAASSTVGSLATVIGTSTAADPKRTSTELKALRADLASPIIVVVGGNDALAHIDGVVSMESLDAFYGWVETLAAASGSTALLRGTSPGLGPR